MHIVNMTKFVIGLVFLAIAAILFVRARGERGFGQFRQAAALGLAGGGIFLAIGLGYLRF
jgi:hypothetical protein